MIEEKVKIINKLGLHARASSQFVKLASQFKSDVQVSYKDNTINGKSILGLMMLAAAKGAVITLIVSGTDEKQAMAALIELVKNKFGEGE